MAGQPIDPFRIKPFPPYSPQAQPVPPIPSAGLSSRAIAIALDDKPGESPVPVEPTAAIATVAGNEPRPAGDRAVPSELECPPLAPADSVNPAPSVPVPPRRRWGAQLLWRTGPFPLAWVLFVLGFSGVGVGAFIWLTMLPPLPDCLRLNTLSTDSERLFCADQAARSGQEGEVRAALRLVQGWGKDHPLRSQSQSMVNNWSKTLLLLARQKADQQDLEGAIALARQIPSTIAEYKEVKSAITAWIDIRDQGKKINATIQAALKVANWSEAQAKLLDLAQLNDNYSRQSVTRLRQQINQEQTAVRQLEILRNQVKATPTQIAILGQSIVLGEAIDPSTYVFAKAEKDIQKWIKILLGIMSSRLAKSDWVGANAVAQQLPLHRSYRTEDRHALWISRGQILATDQLPDNGLWLQLWTLGTTMPPLQRVAATSPFYDTAQALLPRLARQSQDLLQLQLAKTLAQVRSDLTLRWAASMMLAVPPPHPQRLAAQTLLAQWRKEIELAEDYPLLLAARAIAKDGSKAQLQAAIARARLVTPKRARRVEAQTLIAQWTGQIQVIEDRPIIQQARAIAAQGNLEAAIRLASQIQAGRTLYPEAQTAIGDWVAQIQIAEDQAILDRAWGLASAGSLSAAIDAAAQIAPDRPLYSQAQDKITDWVQEREAIWRTRQEEPLVPDQRESVEAGASGTSSDHKPAPTSSSPAASP